MKPFMSAGRLAEIRGTLSRGEVAYEDARELLAEVERLRELLEEPASWGVAEQAPAVVTAEEIEALIAEEESVEYGRKLSGDIGRWGGVAKAAGQRLAALCNARTEAAVEAARREERTAARRDAGRVLADALDIPKASLEEALAAIRVRGGSAGEGVKCPRCDSDPPGALCRILMQANRCESVCPHGDRCTLADGHDGGHNHGCDCNEPDRTPASEAAKARGGAR